VLALPAQPGLLGQRLFHHRRGIDKDFHFGLKGLEDIAGQRLELFLHHIVIVIAQGIDRNGGAVLLRQDRQRVFLRPVIQAQHDDAFGGRPHFLRIGAPPRTFGHPVHLTMMARFKKCVEARGVLGHAPRVREAHKVETFGQRAFAYPARNRVRHNG